MDTIADKINYCSNEISLCYGEIDGNNYHDNSVTLADILPANYEQILDITIKILDDDYKNKRITGMQKKITLLETKDLEKTKEIHELKTDITELKKKFTEKEEKEYIITLIQACRNIECYIVKQFVNWTDDEIRNCDINKFKRDYPHYLAEVQNMEDEFGLTKNRKNISAINEKRKLYAHPNPVDTDELEKACDKFCGKYNGLTDLYKGYMKYYELVRPADDE